MTKVNWSFILTSSQHDSLMQASLCTAKAIRSYVVNGTMPKKGTKCDVKVPLFSDEDGWDEVIKQLES